MQTIWSVRDDFTLSYDARGRHDLKAGGELLRYRDYGHSCRRCMGVIDAAERPAPANIEALFPDPFNADTWNLAAISPLVRTYDVGVGDFFTDDARPQIGAWLQDDWQVAPRADAEPWRTLRPQHERQRQGLQRAAVCGSRQAGRHQQRGAARRLRLPA